MKDGTGREFDDELTHFLKWYLDTGLQIYTPIDNSIHFVENLTSTCIYREGQKQVEFVTVNQILTFRHIPTPNVDSYEVALKGMEFHSNGGTTLPMWYADTPAPNCNLAMAHYQFVRVLPNDEHSAKAGPNGGCFLSVQQWLNGVKPSAVGMDWKGGSSMGDNHDNQITSTDEESN